ncbi:hypothetical protein ACF06X_33315 [Streptomyces sp. NPDC015346]|uniref:hypothetical protein n=1 Tax=Streptomyces sp. NPDC015346 TaxID=3364954 RepID=UPI0036F90241
MRITLSTSDKTVHLATTKGEHVSVRAAEKAALSLFHALPGPAPEPAKPPIGFAVDSDTERADPDLAAADENEE